MTAVATAPRPLIVVGIPVWQGAEFAGETIRSVLGQRGVEFRVIISIDGPDDASMAACRPFLDDPRVTLVTQPTRLGWVKNAAAVRAAAVAEGADYACVQPQDDLLEAAYLSSLLEVAEASPSAAVVYSDIQAFGRMDDLLRQESVIGSPLGRQASLLIDHFNAVAFRGLTRVRAVRDFDALPGNSFDDFAADTVWMAQMALFGDLRRVPRPLYRKRYHARNTHAEWARWPPERKIAAWLRHCLDMLAVGLKAATGRQGRRLLTEAARARLLGTEGLPGQYQREIDALSESARSRLLAEFDAAAAC